jgi:hypothetical protein
VALTAVIAIGQLSLAEIWRQLVIDRTFELTSSSAAPATSAIRAEVAIPRLIVQSSREMSEKPAPLGLTLQGRAEGAVVIITGLVPGMELSTGSAVGAGAWEVSATDLGDVWISPPKSFVGSADLVAELRWPGDKIADRQTIYVEWVSPLAQHQLDREETTAVPPILPAPAQRQLDREEITVVPPTPPAPAQRQLDREEIAVLLKRGKDLIANGDLAAARLVLQRAADANDVEATLALAATYDPFVLRELRVYSFPADAEMARVWYEKARELGSSAASRRLEMLSSGAR